VKLITEVNTYLSLKHKDKIINSQVLIMAKSGGGKSLAGEGIVQKLHEHGYVVMVIADPKDELEYAYQMFTPREPYHLEHLRKIGRKPEGRKLKIYHPFVFSRKIKGRLLPDINFYTHPLKSLGRKEWGLLAETGWESETMKLLIRGSEEIGNEDGIYGFLHYIQSSIKGKKTDKVKKPDPKNFYLETGAGTIKAISEISTYLQPFKKSYFLASENCPLNLNWKEILQDQENYHVFVSNWLDDEKLKSFCVLALLEGILKNKEYLKKPLVVVIPEIRKQCPFKPEGYKKFLSESVKDSLALMRSSGRGMSSVLDSQTFSGIDKEVRDSSNFIFLGELGSDVDNVSKT